MNLLAFKAVILDMDGVIVNSEAQFKQVERSVLREIAPGWTEEAFKRIVGLGVLDLYRLLIKEYGMTISQENFLGRCDDMAEEVYGHRVSLAPGLEHFLAELAHSGIPVAVASSAARAWIKKVLDRFKLYDRFQAVVGVDDVGGEGKPSPAIYLRTADLLKIPPRDCVAVEDSRYGVLSAKRAGITCIGLRNGGNAEQDFSLADFEIAGFQELHALLGRRKCPGIAAS